MGGKPLQIGLSKSGGRGEYAACAASTGARIEQAERSLAQHHCGDFIARVALCRHGCSPALAIFGNAVVADLEMCAARSGGGQDLFHQWAQARLSAIKK